MFVFELESVLKIRKHKEKLEKQKLAGIMNKREAILKEISRRNEKLESYMANSLQTVRSDYNKERILKEFVLSEMKEISRLKKELSEKEKEISNQKSVLLKARRDTEALIKLRQKKFLEYKREAERKEQLFQNEIATQIYYKQQQEWV